MGVMKFGGGMLVMALAGAAYLGPSGNLPADISEENGASIHQRFEVLRAGRQTGCFVSKGEQVSDLRARLEIGTGCSDDLGDYADARYWSDVSDGTVEFVAEDGSVALRFAASDGLAFEAYGPGAPLIALSDASF
ncbi:MAG: hypothetical protein JJ913_12835 [Rhizobiaceae bacterium]|nr:hypothetical protein [Rhizobiaceae bacterium]